jgi:hypothetical protein
MKDEIFGRIIFYYAKLTRITGSVASGLMLSVMYDWPEEAKGVWVSMGQKEWHNEIGFTRSEYEAARRRLVHLGIIEVRKQGMPARAWIRYNEDRVSELLDGQRPERTVEEIISNYGPTLASLSKTGLSRANKLGVESEYVDYADVLRRSGGTCSLCGGKIHSGPGTKGEALHFDHVIPVSKGGSHTMDNIAAAHAHCNVLKGAN